MAPFLEAMHQMLLCEAPEDGGISLPSRLNREKLNFSFFSLHAIDQYLIAVHDNEQHVSGHSLLNTMWATSMYVGETIRREVPGRQFEWVTIGETLWAHGETTQSCPDIGAVRALRPRRGEMIMPNRAVLRIILRGRKAQTIHSFVGAVGLSESAPKAAGAPRSKP